MQVKTYTYKQQKDGRYYLGQDEVFLWQMKAIARAIQEEARASDPNFVPKADHGYYTIDEHMASMLADGWEVLNSSDNPAHLELGFLGLPPKKRTFTMTITYKHP